MRQPKDIRIISISQILTREQLSLFCSFSPTFGLSS